MPICLLVCHIITKASKWILILIFIVINDNVCIEFYISVGSRLLSIFTIFILYFQIRTLKCLMVSKGSYTESNTFCIDFVHIADLFYVSMTTLIFESAFTSFI